MSNYPNGSMCKVSVGSISIGVRPDAFGIHTNSHVLGNLLVRLGVLSTYTEQVPHTFVGTVANAEGICLQIMEIVAPPNVPKQPIILTIESGDPFRIIREELTGVSILELEANIWQVSHPMFVGFMLFLRYEESEVSND